MPRSLASGSPVSPRASSTQDRTAPGPGYLFPSHHLPPHPPTVTANKWGLVAERLLDLSASFSDILTRVQVFVRRLLELHVFKLVALYTVWVALKEVRVGHIPSLSAAGHPGHCVALPGSRAHRRGSCPPCLAQPHPPRLSHRCR